MKTRVISAAVLLPLAIILTLAGGVPFLIGVAGMCALAVWEASALFGAIVAAGTSRAWRYAAVAAAAALVLSFGLDDRHPAATQLVAAALGGISLLALVAGGAPARRMGWWACAAASLLYVVGLGAHVVLLRDGTRGLAWVLLACAVTWGTDTGAYFAGRRFGKHPFFHSISPKKTAEGAVGGALAGVLAAMLVAALARLSVPWAAAALIGLTVSAAAQAGDLIESLLKREAGVKDSGTLIPGHGGVLDRVDSLLVAVALTFYWRLLFP